MKERVGAFRCIGSALEELELGPGIFPLGRSAYKRWEKAAGLLTGGVPAA